MTQQVHTNNAGKPYLLGLVGTLAGQVFTLDTDRVTIGRDPQSNLVIQQAVVSRQQAAIERDPEGGLTLINLAAGESTFVNGAPVTRHKLKEGDRVGFGPGGVIAFSYHSATPATTPPPESAPSASQAEALRAQLLTSARQATTGSRPTSIPALGPALSTAAPQANTFRATEAPVLRVGRAPDNEIVLNAPGVSRYHATLTYNNDTQPMLADLGSANGTFVNGELLTQLRLLSPSDLIFLGGFLLRVEGRQIKRYDLSASRLSATHLTKEINQRVLLKDISLAINPREFIGLMGPSGCGKSTLMDALNGLRPATAGTVYINDLDLYRNFDALRRSIGYVPQRDVLHEALTVERTLYYAAKLRLPAGTPPGQMRQVVDEVITTVGLQEHRTNQFRQLSGGQQKRLSLGLELITKPSFIFLDEPTSPLDPETTETMMLLFRQLADEGRIVVMVTHKFEKFDEMHQVAILTRGGRLAFFGPPREALAYFGCREPSDIYRAISQRDPDELSRAFAASPQSQQYVRARIAEVQELAQTGGLFVSGTEQRSPAHRFGFKQWLTLTQRFLEIKLKDKRNTLLLLAQAPIIAVLLAVITGDALNDAKTLFIAAIISIWFGANNAVREIVAEAPIYSRERLVNLKIPSYVFSKYAVLSGIALIQCLLFISILIGFGRLSGGDFGWLLLTLYLTSLGGITMGLFFSALVNSTEKAMSILPLVLIPQLLLSGYFVPLDDLYFYALSHKPATVADFRRFEEQKNQPATAPRLPRGQPAAPPAVPLEGIGKLDGLGAARHAAALMLARWSVEALSHVVSVDDKKARDALAANMTVVEYQQVFDKRSESEITTAYRQRVWFDWLALGGFNLLFLGLAMWALKRKDAL